MRQELKRLLDPSGKMFREKYVKEHYLEIYEEIIKFTNKYDLQELPFKEKVYHYLNDLKYIIKCKNPNCNNKTNFHNSTIGYLEYCCNKCIGTDPNIIKQKESTSIEKYGVDSYAKSEKCKEKVNKYFLNKFGMHPSSRKEFKDKMKINLYDYQLRRRNQLVEKLSEYGLIKIEDNVCTFFCNGCKEEYSISLQQTKNRLTHNTKLCTNCNPIGNFSSGQEVQLTEFIEQNYSREILKNSRTLIYPLELDIYLPELKIAFEFNGLYWHSEMEKENNYHKIKSDLCDEKGIQLIHIWEDDWLYKQDIVKSMILNKLGKTENKIFARKCEIKEIKQIKDFLNKNHIQGNVNSTINIGLFYKNELVSLMTFGKKRIFMKSHSNENEYELLRFCNKLNTNVIGSASKLFKYFINKYNPKEIKTYADRSYSVGSLYKILGFEFIAISKPNYFYILDGIKKHRFNFRKDVLVREGYDKNKTEKQIMFERKIYRIYNAGQLCFVWKSI